VFNTVLILASKDREGEGRQVYAYTGKEVCDLCKTSVHITSDTYKSELRLKELY
jgi:hypothetical protein